MTDLLNTLRARGFVQDVTPGLADRLRGGPLTAYVGFDPTSDSLHVGSLVPVMGLAWLQRSYDERANWMVWMLKDPRWDPMRSDATFERIVERVGFPAASRARAAARPAT